MSGSPSLPPGGLVEGSTLAGKYRVHHQLGAGGMCIVYEAEHVHLKQAVALKLLKPELAKDATAVARFAQEAQAAAKLRSPNVARVYDVDKLPDGQPYITMELLVGHDLGTELQRRYALPMELAVDYVMQAASGIAEAHALGIVHRDLKPENLFLTDLGQMTERRLLKILDFGIAKNVTETSRKLTAPDAVFGTVDYMSPEQIRSAATVDHRTDLWSLGVILFELLTGRTPYTGDARSVIAQIVSDPVVPPSRFVPTLPPGLVAVAMKALAKDPSQRFQSAEELRGALAPFVVDIEPIADVLARIPTQSMPRRNLDASQPSMSGSLRGDARTNLSFETGSPKGLFAKRAVTLPLLVGGFAALLGLTIWKGNPFRARERPPTTIEAIQPPVDPNQPPAQPISPTPPAATTASILGASTPIDPVPGAGAAQGVSAAPSMTAATTHAAAKTSRPPKPPPPSHPSTAPPPPPPPAPPAPTPTTTATALPKHI